MDVAKMKRRMMLKTSAVPSEKRKGKLFMMKIFTKKVTKNVRRKNTEKSPPEPISRGKITG